MSYVERPLRPASNAARQRPGTAVNVATESLTGPMVAQLAANELSSLFQEQPGTITLQVKSDCSFAATVATPQS